MPIEFRLGNLFARSHFKDQDGDRKATLKLIIKKWVVV
jgi:hypothetical protein